MPCSKGMHKCRLDCAHRDSVREYRLARHNDELIEEAATGGHETEKRERREAGMGPITYKEWLIGSRKPDLEDEQ